MHGTRCSWVGTLGVWRDSSHPLSPLEILNMPLSGVNVFLVHV